jgi:hypothetical protein
MSKNDVTGDEIKSKVSTKEYEDNYDKIFRNKSEANKSLECSDCFCSAGECQKERQKAIAQNGNVGYDLDSIYQRVERDYQE